MNITVGEGIRKLDRAESAVARVGGIPEKEAARRHPLRYMITWAFDHVLREYMIRLLVRKNGEVVEVDAGTDRETFRFTQFGKDEVLECAVTPGMPSFMTSRAQLRDFSEKTVRWPGHWDGVQTLKDCGLLDLAPVRLDGKEIVPRDFLLKLVTPRLKPSPGEQDVCVMYNTVRGTRAGRPATVEYFMWDEADTKHGIRTAVHDIIYKELGIGVVRDESRRIYTRIIEDLRRRGAEGVILGCTEIQLLIKEKDSPVPVFDTTAFHAAAAVDFALG